MRILFPPKLRIRIAVCLLACAVVCGPLALTAQQPASFDDVAALAAAARDQQKVPEAIELYARATQMKPDWQEGWWYLTVLQYGANLYGGAIDAANHLLALEPKAVPAMALRGLSEFEIGDYTGSLRDLEMAVQHGAASDPRNEQIVRYHLAMVLTRASRFQDALLQYRVFAQRGVNHPEMLTGLGLAGMRVPSLPSDVAPQDQAMVQEAGAAGYAFLADRSVEADTLFHQLFERYRHAPNLHLFYGFMLFSHDAGMAAMQFRAELENAPRNDSARALLAYALMLDGKYSDALPEAERVLLTSPDMEMAQLALGRSLGETGQIDRGMDMLKTVLRQDPDNLEAHIGVAALLSKAGKREEAYRERMVCLALAK